MQKETKYFYCYSPKLRRFLTENGINWTDRGINNVSNSPYWIFVDDEKLANLLKQYKK